MSVSPGYVGLSLTQSLWFVPTLMTGGAVVLAIVSPWIDQTVLDDRRAEIGWLFGGGAEGARGNEPPRRPNDPKRVDGLRASERRGALGPRE